MYAIRSYYGTSAYRAAGPRRIFVVDDLPRTPSGKVARISRLANGDLLVISQNRITSYNVCYTKLLRNLSKFGTKFTRKAGITELMDDLGAAMAGGNMLMLGGGNPAHIPAVQARFRQRMEEILVV